MLLLLSLSSSREDWQTTEKRAARCEGKRGRKTKTILNVFQHNHHLCSPGFLSKHMWNQHSVLVLQCQKYGTMKA